MKTISYGKQCIENDDIKAVEKALRSDFLTTGSRVEAFEKSVSRYAVAVSSGTAALDLAVKVLDLPKGSEIITTPFTFVADANCILYNGHKVVFADIDPQTFNISPNEIEKKITKNTRAIIYVDYAGHPCDIDKIRKIAKKHKLFLIEDACHAFGAKYNGKSVGNFADMTIFSFHPVKHITTGEGGMIVTPHKRIYDKLRILRNHGIDKSSAERDSWTYDVVELGRNYRLTDFQCALGISQLKKAGKFLIRRQEIAEMYNKAFRNVKEITTPHIKKNIRHSWHLYTILLDKSISRSVFFDSMRKKGIGVNVHYIPIYKFYLYRRNFNQKLPITEDVYSRIISLPIHPSMTNNDVRRVIEAVKKEISLWIQ